MAHTSATDVAEQSTSQQTQYDLDRMIDEGRSFSGNERNCCFLNTGTGRFATISRVSGLDSLDDSRAVALVDWDQDGDVDMWVSNRNAPRLRLLRNDSTKNQHYLALRLQGRSPGTNRDAIGARVELLSGELESRPLVRTLRAGEGFLSQSSKSLHFGLGSMERIDGVRVRWPGGDVEEFVGMEVDQFYLLVQGSGKAQRLNRRSSKVALAPAEQTPAPLTRTARVPLMMRLLLR